VETQNYGPSFKRARYEAARRLGLPELENRAEAAKRMGIADASLKKLENGDRRPGLEMLEDMARAYGCMVGDLLPSSTPRGPEADKIMGPLMSLPFPSRSLFIEQMGALARMLAAQIADTAAGAMYGKNAENVPELRDAGHAPDVSGNAYTRVPLTTINQHITGAANRLPENSANESSQGTMGGQRGRKGHAE
jgi:transcriptional regulator with XRE-family HTH domain